MRSTQLEIKHEVGLHARPAALFVGLAGKHQCTVQVRNLTTAGKWVNAKSILGVLTLGVKQGHMIEIATEGPDEEEAITALESLVQSNFQEG